MTIIGGFSTTMEACKLVRQEYANEISMQTMQWALNLASLEPCVKKDKTILPQNNIQSHFDYAKSHKNWTVADWKQVIFSNYTKFNRFCSKDRYWCLAWDKEGLTYKQRGKTLKHGASLVMVCGCMSAIGPRLICKIEGIILSICLSRNIGGQSSLWRLSKYDLTASIVSFQIDNDLKHTTKTMKQWLSKQPFKVVLSITQPTYPIQSIYGQHWIGSSIVIKHLQKVF